MKARINSYVSFNSEERGTLECCFRPLRLVVDADYERVRNIVDSGLGSVTVGQVQELLEQARALLRFLREDVQHWSDLADAVVARRKELAKLPPVPAAEPAPLGLVVDEHKACLVLSGARAAQLEDCERGLEVLEQAARIVQKVDNIASGVEDLAMGDA